MGICGLSSNSLASNFFFCFQAESKPALPPHSPKLNGCVERAHRTHTEEFYQVYAADDWELPTLNKVLEEWERIYNQVRPHASLDNLTPKEYIQSNYPHCLPQLSHMY